MIIVKLMGGLGNQLFQYAAGRAASLRTSGALRVDLRVYKKPIVTDTYRKYELNEFGISVCEASWRDLLRVVGPPRFALPLPWKRSRLVTERDRSSVETLRLAKGDVYLSGFWQSERYFEDHAGEIKKELLSSLDGRTPHFALLKDVLDDDSTSVHVRRGDYVNSPATHAFHGVCSLHYYDSAIRTILGRNPKARFFIFSDDIDWCRRNFNFDRLTFITADLGLTSCNEMRLMSLCNHNIIANSSFSWWAAWLNTRPGKIVIAPEKWLSVKDEFELDRLPTSWLRL